MSRLQAIWQTSALTGAIALGATSVGAETINWITYKPQGAGDPQAVTTQWFADELARRTDGEYTIRIHWGGSLSGIGEILNGLTDGVGQIGDIVTPYFPDQLPINNAISFFWPQPNSTIELGLLMNYWHQVHPQFAEELARYNVKMVGLRPLEGYGLICTTPVRSLADLDGLRIRSFGFALPVLIEELGAVPVSMGTPEAYEALERGILDCSPVGETLARGWRYDEVAGYYVDIPLGASWGHLIGMPLDYFNSLPEEIQYEIESIGREYLLRYSTEMLKEAQNIRREWVESGDVEIIQFPADEFNAVVGASERITQVRAEWVETVAPSGLDVDPILDALRVE
jgi:TRAP-type transport system periplasmic protein